MPSDGTVRLSCIGTRVCCWSQALATLPQVIRSARALTAYLRSPPSSTTGVRHSNFIERTFGETCRPTKVIGRFPRETSCLAILWAVLDRASPG